MKKIILCLTLFLIGSSIVKAQIGDASNPYNDVGISLAKDINEILPELQKLKLSDLNQAKIDELKQKITTNVSLTEVQLANYVNITKSNTKDEIINNTSISILAKGYLKKLTTGESVIQNFNFESFNKEVTSNDIPENEKEILLTISAIQYNLLKIQTSKNINSKDGGNVNKENGNGCANLTDSQGVVHTIEPVGCGLLLGAGLGAAGFGICGLPCAAGGFVVGFVVGFFGSK